MTQDEWYLANIPRRLAYEQSFFTSPTPGIAHEHRVKHADLLARQAALKKSIRRMKAGDRWWRWKERQENSRRGELHETPSCLSPMLIDEVIEHGRIVDQG
jgi:hypothetical protein